MQLVFQHVIIHVMLKVEKERVEFMSLLHDLQGFQSEKQGI